MFFWNLEAYLQVCFQVKKLAMVSSVASLAPWQWVWVKAFSVGCNLLLFCAKEICFGVWSAGGGGWWNSVISSKLLEDCFFFPQEN